MIGEGWIFRHLALLVRDVGRDAVALLEEKGNDPRLWQRVPYSSGQGGTPPRELDRVLHRFWREQLEGRWQGSMTVVGEEGEEDFEAAPVGGYIAVVDALDGTSNWIALKFGAGMSVVFYRKLKDRLALISVSLIDVKERTHWWTDFDTAWRGSLECPLQADHIRGSVNGLPNLRDGDHWVVAGVGARLPSDGVEGESAALGGEGPVATREFLNYLTSTRGIHTVTVGGLPLAPALLERTLAALVECKPTTVYDSAHLILGANAEAVVGSLDGHELRRDRLRECFEQLRGPKDRIVPPYILARDRYYYQYLVQAYAEFRRS